MILHTFVSSNAPLPFLYGIPEVFEKIKLDIAYSFAVVRSHYLWYLGYIIILYAVKRIRMIYSGKEQFNKRELQGYSYLCDLQNNTILPRNEYGKPYMKKKFLWFYSTRNQNRNKVA